MIEKLSAEKKKKKMKINWSREVEICKIDEIQGHFNKHIWLISTYELQTDFILKKDASTAKPLTHLRLPKPLLKILPIYRNFSMEKNFPKECCFMLWKGFSDRLIATPEFQIFPAKSIMMVKVVRYLVKS